VLPALRMSVGVPINGQERVVFPDPNLVRDNLPHPSVEILIIRNNLK
jgi:hypothetical protein